MSYLIAITLYSQYYYRMCLFNLNVLIGINISQDNLKTAQSQYPIRSNFSAKFLSMAKVIRSNLKQSNSCDVGVFGLCVGQCKISNVRRVNNGKTKERKKQLKISNPNTHIL